MSVEEMCTKENIVHQEGVQIGRRWGMKSVLGVMDGDIEQQHVQLYISSLKGAGKGKGNGGRQTKGGVKTGMKGRGWQGTGKATGKGGGWSKGKRHHS